MHKLVTGHRGFIGSYLVQSKAAHGVDLQDGQNILDCKLPDADIVYHLAAQTSVITSLAEPMEDATNNILGTLRLAKHYSNARFIYASSGGAIQETIESPYGVSKFCGEQYVKLFCNNYIILRFPNIYGTGSNSVVDKFLDGPVNIFGDGKATRDYIHISDLLRAISLAENWPSGTYSLGSGQNTSVLELAEATGKPITHSARIKGELEHSLVPNTAPNWEPKLNVIDYIKANV